MCRNIKKLRQPEGIPTDEEVQAAALQFIRKVTGYRVPSKANQDVFEQAVDQVSDTVRELLLKLAEKGTTSSQRV